MAILERQACQQSGCTCRAAVSRGAGKTHCVLHADTLPSMNVQDKGGTLLVKCHAGCDQAELVSKLKEFRLWPESVSRNGAATARISVSDLALDKGLPVTFLRSLGLEDSASGVLIPYRGPDGRILHRKRRSALVAKEGSRWPAGQPLMAYGLERLKFAREQGYLILVEGESDAWTGWQHDLPVLGIPGADAARVLKAEHLEGIDTVYVLREPDQGGAHFVAGIRHQLADIGWTGELSVFACGTHKDLSALFLADPQHFGEAVLALLDQAAHQHQPPTPNGLSGAPPNLTSKGKGLKEEVGFEPPEARLDAPALQPPTPFTTPLEVGFPEGIDAVDLRGQELLDEDLPSLALLDREGYIVEGWSNLLAAYPRTGKTELLCACIPTWLAAGHTVLYLTEEPQTLWHARLRRRPEWSRGCRIVPALGIPPDVLLAGALAAPEDIVVVDAIRNLLAFVDENDNSEVARKINPWVAGTRQTRKTLELVHHLRKGAGEHGEGIAGGHALLGSVDIALELLHDQHGVPNRRRIRAWARLIQPPELLYEQTPDKQLLALGDPALLEQTALEQRLLDELSAEEWFTTKELHAALGEPKPSQEVVRKTLTHLAHASRADREPPITVEAKGQTHRWALPGTPRTAEPNLLPP